MDDQNRFKKAFSFFQHAEGLDRPEKNSKPLIFLLWIFSSFGADADVG